MNEWNGDINEERDTNEEWYESKEDMVLLSFQIFLKFFKIRNIADYFETFLDGFGCNILMTFNVFRNSISMISYEKFSHAHYIYHVWSFMELWKF